MTAPAVVHLAAESSLSASDAGVRADPLMWNTIRRVSQLESNHQGGIFLASEQNREPQATKATSERPAVLNETDVLSQEPVLKWETGILVLIVLGIVWFSSYIRQWKRARKAEQDEPRATRKAADRQKQDQIDTAAPAHAAGPRFGPERVKFQSFFGRLDPFFKGKGTVSVADGVMVIAGRHRRINSWERQTEDIPIDRIHDVIVDGRFLNFSVDGDKTPRPRLLLLTTPARAQELAAELPERRSAATQQSIADVREFKTFLEISGRPVVTLALIAINIAVFLFTGIKGGAWLSGDAGVLLELGGNLAGVTTDGQWWRLVSAMFLHAGLLHVSLNMWALWDAGRIAERLFGRLPYAALYLCAGLLGSIASINWQQEIVSVGASGAVFGVYGALLVSLLLRKDLLPLSIAKQLKTSAAVMIFYSLFNGFAQVGIDNAAHIGGLVAGVLVGAALVIPSGRSFIAVITALALIWGGAVRAIDIAAPYRAELAFRQFIKTYGGEETRLNAQMQILGGNVNELKEDEFVRALETEIIPGWEAQDKAISSIVNLTPRMQPSRDLLAKFIHLRHQSLLLLRDAVRSKDEVKISTLKEKNAEAAAVLLEIRRMGDPAVKKQGAS